MTGWGVFKPKALPFVELCALAAKDDSVFEKFKSKRAFTNILEHASPEEGRTYLSYITQTHPSLLRPAAWAAFQRNDLIGGAILHDFGNLTVTPQFTAAVGPTSPSTVRYVGYLARLLAFFGKGQPHSGRATFDGMRFCEIGEKRACNNRVGAGGDGRMGKEAGLISNASQESDTPAPCPCVTCRRRLRWDGTRGAELFGETEDRPLPYLRLARGVPHLGGWTDEQTSRWADEQIKSSAVTAAQQLRWGKDIG